MPNFEDLTNEQHQDQENDNEREDEDDYANDLIYQENHCYTIQKNNQKNLSFTFDKCNHTNN